MTNILITGGAGFIGHSLAKHLLKKKDVFLILAGNRSFRINDLPSESKPRWKFIKSDINCHRSMAKIFHSYHPDYVFHYAAMTGVEKTTNQPTAVFNDINGIRNVLDLSKNTNVKRVFYSSSSEIYKKSKETSKKNNIICLDNLSPYVIVKSTGEALLKAYRQEYGLNSTVFRFFNTYGPQQGTNFVIQKFIQQALKGEPITLHGNGSQTRTFCYINDNIEATSNALFNNQYINDTLDIGSDIEVSIIDLVKTIIKLTGSKSKITHLPSSSSNDGRRQLPNITKMKNLLDHPLTSLEDGLKKMIKLVSPI